MKAKMPNLEQLRMFIFSASATLCTAFFLAFLFLDNTGFAKPDMAWHASIPHHVRGGVVFITSTQDMLIHWFGWGAFVGFCLVFLNSAAHQYWPIPTWERAYRRNSEVAQA